MESITKIIYIQSIDSSQPKYVPKEMFGVELKGYMKNKAIFAYMFPSQVLQTYLCEPLNSQIIIADARTEKILAELLNPKMKTYYEIAKRQKFISIEQ
jgi:hypothetical protein